MADKDDILGWKWGQMQAGKYGAAAKAGRGGGTNWSSYWTTRTPSVLVLTINSDTELKLDWTNGSVEDYDGISIERSVDNIVYSEIDTVAANIETYTDTVTALVIYYYRVRAYKDTEYSPYSNVSYQTEYVAYTNGLTTALSEAQSLRVNQFIAILKRVNSITALSSKFDFLYLIKGETKESAYRNLVKNAHHITYTSEPTWTQFDGVVGDGTNNFLKTNYLPATHSSAYTLNSASLGGYSENNVVGATLLGGRDGSLTRASYVMIRLDANTSRIPINADSADPRSLAIASTIGMWCQTRDDSGNTRLYRNGVYVTGSTTASSGLTQSEIYLLALNTSGTATPGLHKMSLAFAGEAMTVTEAHTLYIAFEKYKASLNPALPRLLVLGDSISGNVQDADWGYNVSSEEYTQINRSANGMMIIGNMDTMVVASIDDRADIAIMALGTNDDNAGDMGTLQAEIEENIDELRVSNPGVKIYYMNVLPRWTDTGGGTIIDKSNIRTAISAACTTKAVTCWDTSSWIVASDTYDGTHTTAEGGIKLWNIIKALI